MRRVHGHSQIGGLGDGEGTVSSPRESTHAQGNCILQETLECLLLSACGLCPGGVGRPLKTVSCSLTSWSSDASALVGPELGGRVLHPLGQRPPGPPRGCPAAAGVTVRADAPGERLLGLIHHAMLGYLVIMFRSASPALKHRSWRAGGPAWELR